jgi:hypothetical protein
MFRKTKLIDISILSGFAERENITEKFNLNGLVE